MYFEISKGLELELELYTFIAVHERFGIYEKD